MLREYAFGEIWTWFGIFNLGLALCSTILLVTMCVRRRYLCFKPGMILLVCTNLFMQWPMALCAPYYAVWLPRVADLCLLVHGLVIGGIVIERFTFVRTSALAFAALSAEGRLPPPSLLMAWMSLTAAAGLVLLGIYLHYVPLECTGLVALLREPQSAPLVRELNLKLLANAVPQYAYTILASCIVYILFSVCLLAALRGFRERRWRLICLALVLIAFAFAAASLTGVKGNLVKLAMVGGALIFWSKQASLKPCALALYTVIGAASLAPALLFYLLFAVSGQNSSAEMPRLCLEKLNTVALAREIVLNENPTLTNAASITAGTVVGQIKALLYRTFVDPLEVGVWYVHYAQTRGPLGIAGVPKLARLAGLLPIDAPNLIGTTYGPLYYGHPVMSSTSAGAGFLFSYYAYFGLWALPIALALLLVLDSVVYVYRRLPPALCLVLASALTMQTMLFLQADLTTVFVTHGIIPTVLFVIGLGAFTGTLAKSGKSGTEKKPAWSAR